MILSGWNLQFLLCLIIFMLGRYVFTQQLYITDPTSVDPSSNESSTVTVATQELPPAPDIKIPWNVDLFSLFHSSVTIHEGIEVTFVNISLEPADYAYLIRSVHKIGCVNIIRIYDSGCNFELLNYGWHFGSSVHSSLSQPFTLASIMVERRETSNKDHDQVIHHVTDHCNDWLMMGDCDQVDTSDNFIFCSQSFEDPIPLWSPVYQPMLIMFDCAFECETNCTCSLENAGLTSTCSNGTTSTAFIVWDHSENPFQIAIHVNIDRIGTNAFTNNTFIGSKRASELVISSDQKIRHVEKNAFNGFHNLITLTLSYNLLKELVNGTFNSLSNLNGLELAFNQLEIINVGAFSNLIHLRKLDLKRNYISYLPSGLFGCLSNLNTLYLEYNQIMRLQREVFLGLENLESLDLSHNEIQAIESNVFSGLTRLKTLDLGWNGIESLSDFAFIRTVSFNVLLEIRNTMCSLIEPGTFIKQTCQGKEGHVTPSKLFSEYSTPCPLQILTLSGNNITQFSFNSFKGLINATVFADHEWLCCFMTSSVCKVPLRDRTTTKFLTCNRLLPINLAMILLWIFGFLAVLGNLNVIFFQVHSGGLKNVQSLLIANLAVSDLLMGIYMLIIASTDLIYGDYFPAYTENWRNSNVCLAAGSLAMLSSEASILFVTLITLDRLMGIRFTFSGFRMRIKSVSIIISGMWLLSLTISLMPAFANMPALNYELSEVCVALPLSRKQIFTAVTRIGFGVDYEYDYDISDSGMYYSIAVFIGLNSICCLIIAVGYIWIFITVKSTARNAGRQRETQEEVRIAMKMSFIVLTDFFCWTPVIIMGILVQAGIQEINPVANAWIVTLLMPINSAINPFMYTLTTVIAARCKKSKKTLNKRADKVSSKILKKHH